MSDIYAMGGKPLTALSIIGFPVETLSHRVMNKILWGGVDKMREAGVVILGGHSLKDKEIKFGFAVTGVVHPRTMPVNSKARPGDLLILTKPLGTGTLSFARQLGRAPADGLAAAERSMAALNRVAAEVMTGRASRRRPTSPASASPATSARWRAERRRDRGRRRSHARLPRRPRPSAAP